MKTLAQRIKIARETLKKQQPIYTQTYVAKLLGLEQQSYNDIESGKSKRPRNLEKLAKILMTTPSWLQYGTGSPPEYLQKHINAVPDGKVPLIPWTLIDKWHGKYDIGSLLDEAEDKRTEISIDSSIIAIEFLSIPKEANPRQFALRITGDSMTSPIGGQKTFLENDIIIIDPEVKPKGGDFVIALYKIDNSPIFAQYAFYGGKVYLIALNPKYPLIEINDSIEICGVVIAHLDVLV